MGKGSKQTEEAIREDFLEEVTKEKWGNLEEAGTVGRHPKTGQPVSVGSPNHHL